MEAPEEVMDFEYLKSHVGAPITMAVVEVCRRQPRDPIQCISKWLFQYERVQEIKKKWEEERILFQEAHKQAKAEKERIGAIRRERTEEKNRVAKLEVVQDMINVVYEKAMKVAREPGSVNTTTSRSRSRVDSSSNFSSYN